MIKNQASEQALILFNDIRSISIENRHAMMHSKLTPQPSKLPLSILSLLSECKNISQIHQIHSHLVVHGHGRNQLHLCKLLRLSFVSFSDLGYSRLLFSSLGSPNVFVYTAMFTGYSRSWDSVSLLELFVKMLKDGKSRPNEFVYPLVLRACWDKSWFGLFKSVHGHASKSGLADLGVVRTALLDGYARFSDVETARNLFDEMPDRNVVSWTALLSGYARAGKIGNALTLFDQMPERDIASWNAIISGCAQNGFFSEALTLFKRMVNENLKPNKTTILCILSSCGHLGMLRLGKIIHGYSYRNHFYSDSFIINSLIDIYGKCGSLYEAKWIFNNLSDKSLATWNSLINSYALHGHSENAIKTFDRMKKLKIEPDEITFVGLLNACTHGGYVDQGLNYFELMTRDYNIGPSIEHFGCMVDLLARAGKFLEAIEMVKNMKIEPDEVVWGSLLNGCRIHKQKDLAEIAIKKLLKLAPNKNVDYGIMLANLYSESGLWDEMKRVRKGIRNFGDKKLPGCSWIEADQEIMRRFYSGDKSHSETEEIYLILDDLSRVMAL